jgi:hypothetical protein
LASRADDGLTPAGQTRIGWTKEVVMRTALGRTLGWLVVSAAVPVLAAVGASGTFSKDAATFKVADGFAYEGKAEFGDEAVIKVRLSAKPLDKKALDGVIDFKAELDRQLALGGDGKYVDLEFLKDGSYRGSSYSLGGQASCGWCGDSKAGSKSKVKVEGASLRGAMQIQPADYSDGKGPTINLTLDLPLATVTGALPLPATGGAPAQALEACRQAVKKKDKAAVKAGCFVAGDPLLAETENVTDEGFWEVALYDRHTLKLPVLKVTGGRTKGDWAELQVEGSGSDGKRKGSVYLRKGPAGWRPDHESLHLE